MPLEVFESVTDRFERELVLYVPLQLLLAIELRITLTSGEPSYQEDPKKYHVFPRLFRLHLRRRNRRYQMNLWRNRRYQMNLWRISVDQ